MSAPWFAGREPDLRFVHHPACDKPDPVAYCDCGENAGCRTCGWGRGAHPCSCARSYLERIAYARTTTNSDRVMRESWVRRKRRRAANSHSVPDRSDRSN